MTQAKNKSAVRQKQREGYGSWHRRSFLRAFAATGVVTAWPILEKQKAWAQEIEDRQEPLYHRLGTGSSGGVYFPIGALIAGAISNPPGARPCEKGGSCGVPGLIAAAQTTEGSVDNLKQIRNGTLESGLIQADIALEAYQGEAAFKDLWVPGLRALAALHPEALQVLVPRDSAIDTLEQLKGKRIGLGAEKSGTLVGSRLILEALGLSLDDIQPFYMAPVDAAQAFMADELDAMIFFGGYPADLIVSLAQTVDIRLLSLPEPVAAHIRGAHPSFLPQTIAAETYYGVEEISTLGVKALWVVHADMDDDLVYDMVQALWHPTVRSMLDAGHALGQFLRPETALIGVTLPLHPGALRYYRRRGLTLD